MKQIYRLLTLFLAAVVVLSFSASLRAQEPVDVEPTVESGFLWYDATQWPVENKGWTDVDRYFARFPARAQELVTRSVWNLSQHSAGEVVRFRANTDQIRVRYTLLNSNVAMSHMPATGVSGLDLYAFDEETGAWRWVGITQPTQREDEKVWLAGIEKKEREYMAYLPLYNGIDALSIGVPEGSEFTPLSPRPDKPIVYYGTSIAHGGCASRPGNAYTAMLGRRLDIPVINLGFSGSAKMELAIAELLGELDAEIYVLDAGPNMNAELTDERMVPFVKKLRELRPDVPILVVEDRWYSNSWIKPGSFDHNQRNHEAIRRAFDTLCEEYDELYYLSADNLLGEDLDDDGTVDGSHPNDLGMYRQANALEAAIRPILEKTRGSK
ncbi:MAG: SGNH/GDSL hydrolase family protein [Thermoguttaceae bacterium]|jgi:hypothetical protein